MPGNVAIAILGAAAIAAALPSPHPSDSYVAKTLPAAVTPEELRNYAETLVAVRKIQRNLKDALTTVPADAVPELRRQADVAIAEVLLRHELPMARFNQISQKVDSDPAVRRTVRQFVMQQQLGI